MENPMKRIHPYIYFILLSVALLFSGCTGADNDISLAPELFAESFAFSPNPAYEGETIVGYVAWEDHGGDFTAPKLSLTVENEYGEFSSLPYTNLVVEGTTKGVLTFEVTVTQTDEGEISLIAQDDAGRESDAITTLLYVSPLPSQE